MSFTLVDIDLEKARMLRTQIKELRVWFDGWEAAGKPVPACHECLWQLMLAIDHSMQQNMLLNEPKYGADPR